MSRSDKTVSVSIEDRMVGPYTARMRVVPDVLAGDSVEYEINLSTIRSIRQHLDNAERSLMRRQIMDAVCGDCETCQNLRTVKVEKHGRPWTDSCPVCTPKIKQAEKDGLLQ